jgi:Tfp pilus assembly protein FimT
MQPNVGATWRATSRQVRAQLLQACHRLARTRARNQTAVTLRRNVEKQVAEFENVHKCWIHLNPPDSPLQ